MLRRLIVIGLMLGVWAAGAPAANPVVTVGSASGNVDSDVRISVTASGMTRLTDFALRIGYDRDALSFVKVEKGTATASWFYVDGSGYKGKLQLIGRNGSAGIPVTGDNQILCQITFHTKTDAFVTTASLMPSSPDGEIKNAALVPGKITITTLPPLKLKIGSGKGAAGTTVTLSVTADGMIGSTAWGFDVSYDRKKLNFVSVAKGTAIKNWPALTGTANKGKVRISATGGSAISGVGLELCKISFAIVKGVKTGSKLDLKAGNCKLGLNGAKKSNGKITVAAPSAPK